jgi:hypothetical protein
MIGSATSSGIPGIGKVPWGTHLCHFFRSRADLIESIVPYFVAGLKNNEQCMWGAAAPLYADEARRELKKAFPAAERLEREGRIAIFDHHEWYTENRSADPVKDLLQVEEKALKEGRKGLRCGGNISWLTQHDWGPFYLYETKRASPAPSPDAGSWRSAATTSTSAKERTSTTRSAATTTP